MTNGHLFIMRWLVLLLMMVGCAQQVQTDWVVSIDSHEFNVEVVKERDEIMRGLMYRKNIPEDYGMLFLFPNEQPRTFWMKNTLIPLDIIFIDNNYKIVKIQEAIPCIEDPCKTYPSEFPAQYVLEINGGHSEKYGIKEGMLINISRHI